MRAISIGIPFIRRRSGVPIDAQAQAHFNRVIADGGIVPSGLSGVNAFFSAVKAIYGTSDINTAISAAYDPHYLGYRLGAGSGTTLGQAAQKMYAPKGIFGGIGTGSAYWEGTGVSGNFVSTPDASANRITGNIDIKARWNENATSFGAFYGKGNQVFWYDFRSNNKFLKTDLTSTSIFSINFNSIWSSSWQGYRMVLDTTNLVIKYYYTTNYDADIWIQIGTDISVLSGQTFPNSGIVGVGGYTSSGVFPAFGKIFRVKVSNAIDGTPVVDFNANQYTGANTWTSTTGEVWTVNSTGAGLADVTQTTAASQPLLLAHTGENYWWGSGASGNLATTPNAAANQITGDIEYIVKCNFANTGNIIGVGKFAGGGVPKGMSFTLKNDIFTFYYSISNVEGSVSDNTITNFPANGQDVFIKVTRNSTTGLINVTSSTDGVTYNNNIASVTGPTGALDAGNQELWVGPTKITGTVGAKVYRATISNSIGGTPVVDFNPSSYNPSTSQTQWTSATGEVWSINVGTATTGYKGAVITKSIVQGDGVDDRLASGTLTSVSTFTRYVAANPLQRAGFGVLVSGGNSLNTAFYKDSSAIRIYNTGTGVGALSFTSPSSHILALFTADYNTTSSKAAINNGTDATGTIGDNPSNSMNVFADNGNNGNGIVNTIISCSTVNTPSQKTAIYNAIRGFNNNAF